MKTTSAKTKWKRSVAISAINEAYGKLTRACEHKHEWDQYLAIHSEEEKRHRGFKPDFVNCGLTKQQSIRLFAVKEVFDRFVVAGGNDSTWTPEAKDFFHVKKSVFAACAIADICKDNILKEFGLDEMREWLEQVDYAELNKDPRMERKAA